MFDSSALKSSISISSLATIVMNSGRRVKKSFPKNKNTKLFWLPLQQDQLTGIKLFIHIPLDDETIFLPGSFEIDLKIIPDSTEQAAKENWQLTIWEIIVRVSYSTSPKLSASSVKRAGLLCRMRSSSPKRQQ